MQRRIAPVWPGGTLTLVRRVPAPNDPAGTLSVFRVTKGDQASLIVDVVDPQGTITGLQFQLDREYQLG